MNRPKATSPTVSIGMPVYNGETFIKEALDSLLSQTFADFELIISDNGSTDKTETICREYALQDQRIRYIRQPENRGAIANFQCVLDEAAGEYFMWAAYDDLRHHYFLEIATKVLDDDITCGLVFNEYNLTDISTGETKRINIDMFSSNSFLKNYFMRLLFSSSSLIYGLHRIDILRKLSLENYDFFDVHLTHWYSIHSKIKIIPLSLYTARINGGRTPYSVTGKFIDPSHFYKAEWNLLRKNISMPKAIICYLIMRYLYSKSVHKLNKEIKNENIY